MKREFSAGGVWFGGSRHWVFAAIRPAGRSPGLWALRGAGRPPERPEVTAVREVTEEPGTRGRVVQKLGDVRYVYTWDGERIFKVVSFYLLRYSHGRLGELPPEMAQRWTRCAGCRSMTGRRCSPTAASARWPRRQVEAVRGVIARASWQGRRADFYSPMVADPCAAVAAASPPGRRVARVPRGHDRPGTRGDALHPAAEDLRRGDRQGRGEDARRPLAARDRARDAEIRRPEEMAGFLGQLYNREVADDELVTGSGLRDPLLGARPQPGGRRAAARRRSAARAAGTRVREWRGPCVGAAARGRVRSGLLTAMPGYVDSVLAAKLVALFSDHEPSHQALIAVSHGGPGRRSR